jgi:hypothetical protein
MRRAWQWLSPLSTWLRWRTSVIAQYDCRAIYEEGRSRYLDLASSDGRSVVWGIQNTDAPLRSRLLDVSIEPVTSARRPAAA